MLAHVRSFQIEVHRGEDMVRFWIKRNKGSRQFRLKRKDDYHIVAETSFANWGTGGLCLYADAVEGLKALLRAQAKSKTDPAFSKDFVWEITDFLLEELEIRAEDAQELSEAGDEADRKGESEGEGEGEEEEHASEDEEMGVGDADGVDEEQQSQQHTQEEDQEEERVDFEQEDNQLISTFG